MSGVATGPTQSRRVTAHEVWRKEVATRSTRILAATREAAARGDAIAAANGAIMATLIEGQVVGEELIAPALGIAPADAQRYLQPGAAPISESALDSFLKIDWSPRPPGFQVSEEEWDAIGTSFDVDEDLPLPVGTGPRYGPYEDFSPIGRVTAGQAPLDGGSALFGLGATLHGDKLFVRGGADLVGSSLGYELSTGLTTAREQRGFALRVGYRKHAGTTPNPVAGEAPRPVESRGIDLALDLFRPVRSFGYGDIYVHAGVAFNFLELKDSTDARLHPQYVGLAIPIGRFYLQTNLTWWIGGGARANLMLERRFGQ